MRVDERLIHLETTVWSIQKRLVSVIHSETDHALLLNMQNDIILSPPTEEETAAKEEEEEILDPVSNSNLTF